MKVTCINCGCETFKSGDISPSLEGGYDVVAPCSQCGTPNTLLHEQDPEFAKMLLAFFAGETGETTS